MRILGARERSDSEVREVVLADDRPMVPLVMTRVRGGETALEVKEVVVGDWGPGCKPRRYVVCFNPEEAKRDAAAREAILDSLRGKLQGSDATSEAPRPTATWCHVALNFPDSSCSSITSGFELSNFSQRRLARKSGSKQSSKYSMQ